MRSIVLVFLRALVVTIGLIGISWGISDTSLSRQQSEFHYIEQRIIAGDSFRVETLLNQAQLAERIENEGVLRPAIARSAAVMRLRLAEVPENPTLASSWDRKKAAIDSMHKSLRSTPADPFFWLVLFSLDPSASLGYLEASYRLGPNEGWIAIKRNSVAFGEFDDLPADIRDAVLREFLGILKMGFYDEAVKTFIGPAWDRRELILSKIDQVPQPDRQKFAEHLAAAGYDVIVPGTHLDAAH